MKLSELSANPEMVLRILFVGGVWVLFVALLPHDPLLAWIGLMMIGIPVLHRFAASPQSWVLGRYRRPVLAAAYVGMWAGIVVGIGWAARGLVSAFG